MTILWAFARHTLYQAIRQRITIAVMGLFLLFCVLLTVTSAPEGKGFLGLGMNINADNTQLGEVKVLLTYNITIITFLLTAMTILLSATTFDSEVVHKQIFLIASKPVRHWQLLLGKWLGIVLFNAWLLLFMGVITLIQASYFSLPDPGRPFEHLEVKEQVMTSRASIRPHEINPELEIRRQLELLRANGATEEQLKENGIIPLLQRNIEKNSLRLLPLMTWKFSLDQIPQSKKEGVLYTIRHKLYAIDSSSAWIRGEWGIQRPDGKWGVYRVMSESKSGTVREFTFPSALVDEEGRCDVYFRNLSIGDPNSAEESERVTHTVAFSIKDGLEVLAPQGTFSANLVRAGLLLLIRLATLAAIGIAATSILSMPVATFLFIGFILPYGYGSQFLLTKIAKETQQASSRSTPVPSAPEEGLLASFTGENALNLIMPIWHNGATLLAHIPPALSAGDPEESIILGREISWNWILHRATVDLLLRGGGSILIGLLLLSRRELGRPVQ